MIKYVWMIVVCAVLTWCVSDTTIVGYSWSGQTQCSSPTTGGAYNCSLTSWTGLTAEHRNVLWQPLESCGTDPVTGFERDGYCKTWPQDPANHSVCAVLTDEFLQYTRTQGNDLITPNPRYQFPGLKAGDHWCLCAARWYEAYRAWVVTEIITGATHISALQNIPSSVFWL